MSGLAFGTSALLVQPVVAWALQATSEGQFGLFQLWEWPWFLEVICSFLLLDLSFYYWHRLNHIVPLFWRFHNVHHIDPDMDVSTGFRFHPGEIAFSVFFRGLQLTLLGVGGWVFVAYETVFQAGTLFHHSNVRLPWKVERVVNWLFVTPRMHGLHHSVLKNKTNSNYSVVFSLWDRVHRSFSPIDLSQDDVGVPGYSEPDDNSLLSLVKMPFQKQRSYWPE